MLHRVLWIALLFVLLDFHQIVAQDSLPPYLYYFSPQINAFVIERADGSDRRLLGEGLAPEGTNSAGGSWSPSGRYFAWTTSTWAGPSDVDPDIWIVSANGTKRLDIFDNLGDVAQMAWSPIEDLLFVVDKHVDGAVGATYYLVDVANRDLVTSFTLFNWQDDLFLSYFQWTPDGSHVVLFYDASRWINGEWVERRFRRTISRNGVIDDNPIGDTLDFEGLERAVPNFSPMGDLAYFSEDKEQLIVEHIPTGYAQSYELPSTRFFNDIFWSNTGEYALLTRGQSGSSAEIGAEFWLLTQNGLSQITENVRFEGYYTPKFWSPYGDIAQFVTLDGKLHIFDPRALETTTVNEIENAHEAFWLENGESVYVVTFELGVIAYLYDITLNEVHVIDGVDEDWGQIISSPDSHFFALGDANAVLAIRSREVTSLISQERGMRTSYLWHQNSNWLIYNQVLYVPGGGNGPIISAVTNLEGSVQRNLSEGFTTARWLPDNAIPHLLGGDHQ